MEAIRRIAGIIALAAIIMATFIACGPPRLKGAVTIDGDPVFVLGQTLTANTASLGGSGIIFYQWMRNGATIDGEDKTTYTLQDADRDAVITVIVIRSDNTGSVTSAPITAHVGSLTGIVSIDGDPMLGKTLKANTASLDGSGTISYQWMRGGEAINGADKSVYTLKNIDKNSVITVTVTRSDNIGSVISVPVNAYGYLIGMTGPGGGKIFYRDEKGFTMTDTGKICHYLEAALINLGELTWASSRFTGTDITDTETYIGSGRKNTALILAVDSNAPAALACKKYSNNGMSDWFLPSSDELGQLCANGTAIGISSDSYWSSSQYDSGTALLPFAAGRQYVVNKNNAYNVRAIRAF